MEIVNLPKPNGRTVEEKYEYAKFLMLCKEPTLELLNFLDREQENFTYQQEQDGPWSYIYSLVWSKGELFDNLYRQDVTNNIGYDYRISRYYFGFSWANTYERPLLEKAFDKLIHLSGERTRLAEIKRQQDADNAKRSSVKEWLNNHEEN